jgi:adenine-specific DNA glycosylase
VIVSEFMLQQTQVSRVEPYYRRFLESYPSIEALAGARRRTLHCGAVASLAFERSAPAVDTNVAPVIRRAFHPRCSSKTLSSRV